MALENSSLQFVGLQGETLIKNPGSINGESFSLRDLTDCSVYLLDYTSDLDCSNCVNCQIFIGPVDGPAVFVSCQNCNVAVACQQFQAKECTDCEFGLYCATVPSISGCSSIKVSCWSGAYAGLNAHFAAANLDPTKNQWNKIYDASATNDQTPNFTLNEGSAEPWEVTVEGADGLAAENPVPNPENVVAVANNNVDDISASLQNASLNNPAANAVFPSENGNEATDLAPSAADAAAGYDYEPPTTAAARDQLQERLSSQAREESDKRAAAQAAAARYLEEFYQKRNASRDARIAQGRNELARRGSTEAGPEGESVWERAISMVDFNAARPGSSGGTDLSRFKSVLFACKERGTTAAAAR